MKSLKIELRQFKRKTDFKVFKYWAEYYSNEVSFPYDKHDYDYLSIVVNEMPDPIGFIMLGKGDDAREVRIFINDYFRNMGYGKIAIALLEVIARDSVTYLWAEVNEESSKFFQSVGWEKMICGDYVKYL